MLFDTSFFRKLELLELCFRRLQAQPHEGRFSSHRIGGRVEFADHRTYAPGDDPRYLDWSLYARTERFFTKEFCKEEMLQAVFLLDGSASMEWGEPSKWDLGRRVAAAVAFIALAGSHAAGGAVFSDGRSRWTGRARSRSDFAGLASFLRDAVTGGSTALVPALADLMARYPRPCLVVLVSDLLDERDPRGPLALLAARGYDLALVHVLAPEEVHPPWSGPRLLLDAETGAARPVLLDPHMRSLYVEQVEKFREGWQEFCSAHQMLYFPITSATPFEDVLLDYLRRGGLVKRT